MTWTSRSGYGMRPRTGRRFACAAALLTVAIVAGCSPSPSPSAWASPVSPEPEPSDLGDTPPPLNATESWIVKTLDALGIAATRGEYSFGRGAAMWSRFDDGSELFVFVNPVGLDRPEASVVARREIAGVTVERVEYASIPTFRDRFQCGDLAFETEGAVPPGYDDFDSFLARFIAELDCSQAP